MTDPTTYGLRSACSQLLASAAQNCLQLQSGMSFGMPTIIVGVFNYKVASNQSKLEFPDLILSDEQSAWIGSVPFLVNPIANIMSGYLMDYVGRKTMMLCASVPFCVGWILIYYSKSSVMFMLSAVLMGLGTGTSESPLNTYTGEMCEPRMRGSLTLMTGIGFTFGFLLTFIILALADWHTVALTGIVIPVITIALMTLMPESPRYLISRGKLQQAEKSLRWLRGWSKKTKVMNEFNDMVLKNTEANSANDTVKSNQFLNSLNSLRRPEIVRPFYMIVALYFLMFVSSQQPMRPFLVEILTSLGMPLEPTMVLVLTNVLSFVSIFAGVFTVNKLGKRRISLISFTINTVFSFVLSLCAMNSHWPGWIALASYSICFSISSYGMVLLPWMLISEVYPLEGRGIACGVTAASFCIIGFITTKTYIDFIAWFGLDGTLFIYTAVSLLGTVCIYFYLPETEDRTLEEILDFFAHKQSARKFKQKKATSPPKKY